MRIPEPSTAIFLQIAHRRWRATLKTPAGLITAIGNSRGEAKHQLEELLVIRRALEFTLDSSERR